MRPSATQNKPRALAASQGGRNPAGIDPSAPLEGLFRWPWQAAGLFRRPWQAAGLAEPPCAVTRLEGGRLAPQDDLLFAAAFSGDDGRFVCSALKRLALGLPERGMSAPTRKRGMSAPPPKRGMSAPTRKRGLSGANPNVSLFTDRLGKALRSRPRYRYRGADLQGLLGQNVETSREEK